ncbi:WecB/TagA/CpsF family glycosyltransferase [Marinibactrum halimedae]|uniref:Glycosyltransferase n=1 Tax=Marinibactrum halimedae TaxID=1444977 RepID=A0AA37T2A0_9GAMM|nr:WecB/TagA/CpsF family glycosyltransferase [Marinibactrum halimedae]MCD9457837.1 WecB/TagA/CpsF family glycosyltransferase [Marinibactrum halimedae]GLS24789.1 hypothetical protein GCM10007877_05030 [Marinibactrum halimedae]
MNTYLVTHGRGNKRLANESASQFVIAATLIVFLIPIWLVNVGVSFFLRKNLFKRIKRRDCLGRVYLVHFFNCGLLKSTAQLLDVLRKNIAVVGLPDDSHEVFVDQCLQRSDSNLLLGMISVFDIHKLTGLCLAERKITTLDQTNKIALKKAALIVIKYIACRIIYRSRREANRSEKQDRFTLFGLNINNVTMNEAVSWIVSKQDTACCKTAVFVNVNSVNLSLSNRGLSQAINQADKVFADGSGVRIACSHIGVDLKDNVNGTDLLPHLCRKASKMDKSIFLLGGQDGVAEKAKNNLLMSYPDLSIAGSHHGYFKPSETNKIIEEINNSGADILLLAMGSPIQEAWLQDHKHLLHCQCALAVGGLFDFFSGKVKRAPLYLRELGLEWVWRLLQEPKTKFNRYVIGNPIFLFRTFVLNQAGEL